LVRLGLFCFFAYYRSIIENGPHLRLERLPQQHQQCREARQAPGFDPPFVQGHYQVLVLDAEARYVDTFVHRGKEKKKKKKGRKSQFN